MLTFKQFISEQFDKQKYLRDRRKVVNAFPIKNDTDLKTIAKFIEAVSAWQQASANIGLVEKYSALPAEFKQAISTNLENLYRADQNENGPIISFTRSESYAHAITKIWKYEAKIITGKNIISHQGIIDTEKLYMWLDRHEKEMQPLFDKYFSGIGDDEGEVIVLKPVLNYGI